MQLDRELNLHILDTGDQFLSCKPTLQYFNSPKQIEQGLEWCEGVNQQPGE